MTFRITAVAGISSAAVVMLASASQGTVLPARTYRIPSRAALAARPFVRRQTDSSCTSDPAGANAFDTSLQLDAEGSGGDVHYSFGNANVAAAADSGAFVGSTNEICGTDSVIAGGIDNAIADGSSSTAEQNSAIGAGDSNFVISYESFIGAGDENTAGTFDSFLGGGISNNVNGSVAFIGGGSTNVVSGHEAFVGAGYGNQADGAGSFIGAGGDVSSANPNNRTTGEDSFIGAGDYNAVKSSEGFIGSGARNVVSGGAAAVLAGFGNTASGSNAVVAGGDGNSASGTDSFAAGYHAEAAHDGSFVWSDFVSGSANVSDSAADQFIVRASGGTTIYSNEAATSGVTLAAGSGSWSSLSDRNAKTEVVPIDDKSVLSKVASLPISIWRSDAESGVRHIGPTAQDFYAAFGVGEDDRHIASIDEDGIALAALKALRDENAELRVRSSELEAVDMAKIDAMRAEWQRFQGARGARTVPQAHQARTRATLACNASSRGSEAFDSVVTILSQIGGANIAYRGFGSNTDANGSQSGAFEGSGNLACSSDSVVFGGENNATGADSSANDAKSSFIGSGQNNQVTASDAFLGAGNTGAANGYASFVGAGLSGHANGSLSFVGAGSTNTANGNSTFIGAGYGNYVTGAGSFAGAGGDVSAGRPNNQVSGQDSFAGSGDFITVSSNEAFAGAGSSNAVSGQYAALLGGSVNAATASYAVVLGGGANTAKGILSFAGGYDAKPSHNGSFMWADDTSTALADTAVNQFVVRASGGTTVYSNEGETSGVTLAAGSGTWASLSDRNAKTDVVPSDETAILGNVATLPVSTWRYKTEAGVRHAGPMAQDFYAAFGVGEDDRHIATIDEDGVALAAIKALHRENGRLRAHLAALEAQSAASRTELAAEFRPYETARRAGTACASSAGGAHAFDSVFQFDSDNNNTGGSYSGYGSDTVAAGQDSGVFEGSGNQVCESNSVISGGVDNAIAASASASSAQNSFIGAGQDNAVENYNAFIGAGDGNVVSGFESVDGAGANNEVTGSVSFIGAGSTNTVSAHEGFVGDGYGNDVSGNGSFIGAGGENSAESPGNEITGEDSFIGAGDDNEISSNEAFVGSGAHNVVSGLYGAVLGGFGNAATGPYAVVAGGDGNTASGTLSFAAGYHAQATHNGSFVWSDYASGSNPLEDTAANQFVVRASGGATVYSNAGATTGVSLSAGSGTWSNLVTAHAETAVAPLDEARILTKVAALPIDTWQYKTESGVTHIGPMAQDFYAAFGLGADDRHITSIDEDGLALAAIKALLHEDADLRARTLALESKNVAARAELRSELERAESAQMQSHA